MKLIIEIEMDNDAFQHPTPNPEVARILDDFTEHLKNWGRLIEGGVVQAFYDINGNYVGKAEVQND